MTLNGVVAVILRYFTEIGIWSQLSQYGCLRQKCTL